MSAQTRVIYMRDCDAKVFCTEAADYVVPYILKSDYDALQAKLTEAERQKAVALERIALAYGYLWHVNTEPMAPVPMYSPQQSAMDARKILRDLMTHEQRGEAIGKVQALLGSKP